MAQLLVYTQNNFLRYAIDSLTVQNNSVTYFTNRVQFLACATVLEDAVLLIDAINNTDDSIRWLGVRLNKIKTRRKLHYLVPLSMLANNFIPGLSLIAETFHLKSLFFFTWGDTSSNVKKNVYEEIISKLKRTISTEDYSLIKLLYSRDSGKCKNLSRKEFNKIYYIRKKKLHLNNSTEFKQFILFLTNNTAMQDTLG